MLQTPHKTLLRKNSEQRYPLGKHRQQIGKSEESTVDLLLIKLRLAHCPHVFASTLIRT